MLKNISLLLFATFLLNLQSPTYAAEKECADARYIALFGQNTPESPFIVKTVAECCEACRKYTDGGGCQAYTFYYGDCDNQCWLKTRVTFQYFKANAVSGSYYITAPDGKKKPKTALLDIPGAVDTTVESLPSIVQRTIPGWVRKQIDADCPLENIFVNSKYYSGKSAPLPIFNLKCPEDCRKACYDHQEMSGRYSCVAFNFVYAKDVSECWLLTGTGLLPGTTQRIPKPGYACGESSRSGHEMGPPPIEYKKILTLYRDLLKDSTKCVGTIEDLDTVGS